MVGKRPGFKYGINPQQRARVQAMTGISEDAVKRWERGEDVTPVHDFALRRAFRQLAFPLPKRKQ